MLYSVALLQVAAIATVLGAPKPDFNTGDTCIKSCAGYADGVYQPCFTCEKYVTCQQGKFTMVSCLPSLQYDDEMQECVSQSTTCSLPWPMGPVAGTNVDLLPKPVANGPHHCVETREDCDVRRMGRYQYCKACSMYVFCKPGRMLIRPCLPGLEWDDKYKVCRMSSSTCDRLDLLPELSRKPGVEDGRDLIPRPGVEDGRDLLPKLKDNIIEEVLADNIYEVDDAIMVEYAAMGIAPSEELAAIAFEGVQQVATYAESTDSCVLKSCEGRETGRYQFCKACSMFVYCAPGGRMFVKPCQPGLKWDDNHKVCRMSSSTCSTWDHITRPTEAPEDNSVETPNSSVEEPETSVEEPDTSVEEPDTSVEEPDTSVEEPDISVEESDTELVEEPDNSVEEPNTSVEKPDTSVEEPDTSVEEPDTSVEEPDTSVEEEPDTSVEEPDTSVEEPETSLEDPDTSVEEPDISAEEPDTSVQEPDTSKEKPDTSMEESELLAIVKEPSVYNFIRALRDSAKDSQ